MVKILLTIVFVIICVAATVIILMQEGESAGLGAISGAADTYWGKNKARSMEGRLQQVTRYLIIGIFVLALVLNLNIF